LFSILENLSKYGQTKNNLNFFVGKLYNLSTLLYICIYQLTKNAMKTEFKKGQKAVYKHISLVNGKFVRELFNVTIIEVGNNTSVCILLNGQHKWTEISNVTVK
jgi:hypothetical protein